MILSAFSSVDISARRTLPPFARWAILVTFGLLLSSPAVSHLRQQAPTQQVIGEWTLCRSEATSPAKKGLRSRSARFSGIVANAYTEIVFRANGTGEAGLTGGKKRVFSWQQHGDSLTVAYPEPGGAATRLKGGSYQVVFASQHTPALTLRTRSGVLYLN